MSAAPDRPAPAPDAATAPYWSAARERRLVLPRCLDCARWHFYPRSVCPHCGSARLAWAQCSGRGEIYSFTVVHRAPSPAFAAEIPYVVAIVRLAEGPHLMTNIVNADCDAVRIGMKVQVAYRAISASITLPVFELSDP